MAPPIASHDRPTAPTSPTHIPPPTVPPSLRATCPRPLLLQEGEGGGGEEDFAREFERLVFRDGGYDEVPEAGCAALVDKAEHDLTRLDAFLHAVHARAVRLAMWVDQWRPPSPAEGAAEEEGSKPVLKREVPREVRVFTELLPSSDIAEEAKVMRAAYGSKAIGVCEKDEGRVSGRGACSGSREL